MTKKTKFPPGWDESRVKRVLQHYESQSEYEAFAEDEAAYEDPNQTFMRAIGVRPTQLTDMFL